MAKKPAKKSNPNEYLELEKAYNQVSDKKKKKKGKKSGIIVAILICLVAVIAAFFVITGILTSGALEDGIIMEGVSLLGVDVGGMSKEEALDAISPIVKKLGETSMVVEIMDTKIELSPELTEISFDSEAAVDAAYGLGRTAPRALMKEQQLKAVTIGIDVEINPYLHINQDAIVAKLNTLGISSSSDFDQSNWEITGTKPDLTEEEAPTDNQILIVNTGSPQYTYDQDALVEEIIAAYQSSKFEVFYDVKLKNPDPIDLDAIYKETYIEPVDSAFGEDNLEASPHSYGYGFNLEEAKLALSKAQHGETLEFPFIPIAPQTTKAALEAMLFRDELSSHSAYYSSGYNRATNLRLACEALNGTVLMPGETLSYNNTLGERTSEKGYLPAASYVGGKTEDTLGGGICQPSSVLYYCVLLADLEVVERYCHQYFCTYMDPGMDATVFWNGPDFKFRNNTDFPVRVEASANGGTVSIKLMGTDTKDYYVDMEYEWLDTYGWDTKYEEFTKDNNPKGYKDGETITSPYTGYKYNTYKCKYSKEDDTLISRTFETTSTYDKRDKVVAKDVSPEEETEEPTEKPTNPPTEPPAPTTPPVVPTEPPEEPTAPPVVPTEPPESEEETLPPNTTPLF